MKKTSLLFVLALVLGAFQWAFAAPLTNIPIRLTQPDGQVIECFASGDEFYNYLHDANGFTIVQGEGGYYCYAMHNSQGEVVASPYRVNSIDPTEAGLQPYVKISEKEYLQRRQEREQYIRPIKRPADREINHGRYNNLVVFIRFAGDTYHTSHFSNVNTMFNGEGYLVNSLHNYYHHASYNQLDLWSYFFPQPDGETLLSYEDIHPKQYYQPYDPVTNPIGYLDAERTEREFSLLERAINYIEDMVPDTLDIDYNDDGLVDNVVFVCKGETGEWNSLLWPHRWSIYDRYVPLHNLRVFDFNLQLEQGGYFNVSTLCHEMNHSLSAPDLYHYTSGGPNPVGAWDLMCGNTDPPQHMSAYMKYKYGHWIDDIPEITEYGTYELEANSWEGNGRNAYRIASIDPYQYYVIEYRDNTRLFETELPDGGLLIYRIDTRFDGNAGWNGTDTFDEVYIFRPNGYTNQDGDLSKASFCAERDRTVFNHESNPAPFLTNGQFDENFCIYNISSRGDRMSFTYGPVGHTLVPQNLIAHVEAPSHQVVLKWDETANADSYVVYRDGERFAEGLSEPQYSHAYSDSDKGYHTYRVSAVVDGDESGQSESQWIILGNYENLRLSITSTSPFGTKGGELEVSFGDVMAPQYLTIYEGETAQAEYYVPAQTEVNVSWAPGFDPESEGIHVTAKRVNQDGVTSLFDTDRPQAGVLAYYTVADDVWGVISSQHLTATSDGQQIQLNWTIPTENHYFNIFRDNRKLQSVQNSYAYLDNTIMRSGVHRYHVESTINNLSSWNPDQNASAATINFYCEPPQHLEGAYSDGHVELDWEAPEFFGQGMLAYDDDQFIDQIGTNSHKWGIKFEPELLAHFDGHPLTHIELFDCSTGHYTFTIYNGESANNSSTLYVQQRDMEGSHEFVRFALDEPVVYDPSLPLWICVSTSGTHEPIPCCEYTGESNSCLLKQGNTWKPATQFGMYRSWLLRGYTSPVEGSDDFTYNVYWGPEEGGEEMLYLGYGALMATQASYNTTQDLRYNVTAIWDGRETEFSNTVYLGPSVGVEEVPAQDQAFVVYPNPVSDQLTLQGEGLRHVSLIALTGAIVYDSDITGNGIVIDTKALPQGLYLLRVCTDDGVKVDKVVKR
jgi:M6 family metalloprotease-like protein